VDDRQSGGVKFTEASGRDENPWSLTPREREVLALVCDYKRDKEIAEALGISLRTVEKHMEKLRQKLGIKSRREAQRLSAAKQPRENT
jgi:DNA-binding CsgD family transcriptional regulator